MDPSQLSDEELDQAIESSLPSDQSPDDVKPTTETVEEVTPQVEAPKEVEEEEEEQAPPSRRENLRIQQLLERMKQQPQEKPTPRAGIDYRNELDADDEVIEKLESDRQAVRESSYSEGLEQAKSIQFHTRLDIDAPKVEAQYPILNPKDKEHFDPAVANAVNSWYLNMVGYDRTTGKVQNSDIRYADFAESIFELADSMATRKAAASAKNIAKQAATTAIRPDGSSAKRLDLTKAPGAMSDEELDAVLKATFGK